MSLLRPRNFCFFVRLTALILVPLVFMGCAGMQQKGAGGVGQAAAPPKGTGHVVNIQQDLPVRMDTSLKSKQLGKLYLGEKVYIDKEWSDKQKREWVYVTKITAKGASPLAGWVLKKYIEEDPLPTPSQTASSAAESQNPEKPSLSSLGAKARTLIEGAVTGALIGAAGGAAIAALSGKDPATGALIGAGVGLAGGLIAGNYVANQKEKFATEEAYLDACIMEAMQYNMEARSSNELLKKYIDDTECRIRELKAQIKRDSSKKQVAKAQVNALNAKKKQLDDMIATIENEIKAQESAIKSAKEDSVKLDELKAQVQITRDELSKLKQKRDKVVELTTKMNGLTV